MLPRKTPRCRQRRNPTRATSVPTRRIPTVHGEVRTVLTPTISVVSQLVRIETMPRSTAAFHRSKPKASACEATTRPTIVTRTTARPTQTLPLTPRLRGRGGGSPEGRRRLPPPPGPRCGVTLRLGEVPAASLAMADATAVDQARDTAISAPIPPSGLKQDSRRPRHSNQPVQHRQSRNFRTSGTQQPTCLHPGTPQRHRERSAPSHIRTAHPHARTLLLSMGYSRRYPPMS